MPPSKFDVRQGSLANYLGKHRIIPHCQLTKLIVSQRQQVSLGRRNVNEAHRDRLEPELLGSLEPGMARDDLVVSFAR